jgi:hypothetical protein
MDLGSTLTERFVNSIIVLDMMTLMLQTLSSKRQFFVLNADKANNQRGQIEPKFPIQNSRQCIFRFIVTVHSDIVTADSNGMDVPLQQ